MAGSPLLSERHTVEVTPESLLRRRYLSLPVEVPVGTAELTVALRYEGGARIDLGVLDPRSSDGSLSGFRGWSGSSRDRFVIQAGAATPGYLAGRIQPGRWQVLLGLYVVDEPVSLHVEVSAHNRCSLSHDEVLEHQTAGLSAGGASPANTPASRLAQARGAIADVPGIPRTPPPNPLAEEGWIRGDLHSHTNHSNDSEHPMTLEDAVAAAEARGLDFLAPTDHNTTSHWKPQRELGAETQLVLIRAEEVTTYYGHFNAFGGREIIDFRVDDEASMYRAVEEAVAGGALVSLNHPKSMGPRWEFGVPEGVRAVEAWQAPWPWGNRESIAYYDALLNSGRRLSAIGGSDLHDLFVRPFHQLGSPTTWVRSRGRSQGSVVKAIDKGRTMISASPEASVVLFEHSNDGHRWRLSAGRELKPGIRVRARVVGAGRDLSMRLVGSRGELARRALDTDDQVIDLGRVEGDEGWLRAELWEAGIFRTGPVSGQVSQLHALCGPAYITRD